MNKLLILVLSVVSLLSLSCSENKEDLKLPIYGEKVLAPNGKDTIYVAIPEFKFINQDSVWVTNKTFENKIYVADFFFTSCPTICPRMKSQMIRVHEKFKDNKEIGILSHSIDPEHDTPEVLKNFTEKIGLVEQDQWHFVTGDKDVIYSLAEKYMVTADEDPNAPGGYIHSGSFILIDKNGNIRGYYDGTDPLKVDIMMSDINLLLHEK